MKKFYLITCLFLATLAAEKLSAEQIISLLDVHDESLVRDFTEGKMSDYILECSKGMLLPFKIRINGEFFAFELDRGASAHFKVLKTCYIRAVSKEEFLFSTDLQEWKGAAEFFTGKLGLSLHVEEKQPVVALDCELNQRVIKK